MNFRTHTFGYVSLIGCFIVLLTLALFLTSSRLQSWSTSNNSEVASAAQVDAILASTKARIVDESRNAVSPAIAEGPLISGQVSATNHSMTHQGMDDRLPPEGYEFVSHHGEMIKARLSKRHEMSFKEESFAAWLDWPESLEEITKQAMRMGRDWTFGWIRIAEEVKYADAVDTLKKMDSVSLGSSGQMVWARLPRSPKKLREIAALEAVDGIGAIPIVAKIQGFSDESMNDPTATLPVFVTLMTQDPSGYWRRQLETRGAVVGNFDPALRLYTAIVTYSMIEDLAALDFVQAIEPIGVVKVVHDTAVSAMGVDAVRPYGHSPGVYLTNSGSSVPIGVMDTGLNINHIDIASNRQSICGATFAHSGFQGTQFEDDDLWIDKSGHGTHVTGSIAGNGFVAKHFAGMAPGVSHIRFAKVLNSDGLGDAYTSMLGMDFLADETGCGEGAESEIVKPLIVNMSLAASSLSHVGRDPGARKLDSQVWNHRQLYVVAQSNEGKGGYSNYAAAKNSLAVGATLDEGSLASFSSHGPTLDGRLSPNVVGTGVRIHSAEGDGSRGRYVALEGTSMAAPVVAGVAVLLMDAVPSYKEQPALVRSRLMASAIRPDPWLADEDGFPLNNSNGPGSIQAKYGMGKVSARTSVLQRDQDNGWRSGSVTADLRDGEYTYHDIEVPHDARRLDIVLTWDEPAADAVASTVLNDLDLWLDQDADCDTEACGEHASLSRIDNVEWTIVKNPEPGIYRVKVLARRVYSKSARAAVAWQVIRGASTPTLSVDADQIRLEGEREHQLNVSIGTNAYVASGVRLHFDCLSLDDTSCNELFEIESARVLRDDGIAIDLSKEDSYVAPPSYSVIDPATISLGSSVPIGEIDVDEERQIELRIVTSESSNKSIAWLKLTASAWNGLAGATFVGFGDSDKPTEYTKPINDDFASVIELTGQEGSTALDLMHATPEPGEPDFYEDSGRPVSSVWYSWTAPADGPIRFEVSAPERNVILPEIVARHERIDVYRGEKITSLSNESSGLWGTQWFSQEGITYFIRVSSASRGTASLLRWTTQVRPINDNFAEASILVGGTGSVKGSTAGATLESGESFGQFSSTTWYKWIAPSDGVWTFERTGSGRLMVFAGDDFQTLRLVSSMTGVYAYFPASSGTEYYIAIAEERNESGAEYSINWEPRTENEPLESNDLYLGATTIESNSFGENFVDAVNTSTVEPLEPIDAGVLTKWWSWQSPESRSYTWKLLDREDGGSSHTRLRVSMYEGESLENLVLIGKTGPGAPYSFIVDVIEDQRYSVAVGLPNGNPYVFQSAGFWREEGKLVWGPTPANDDATRASTIFGMAGSLTGDNTFATEGESEYSHELGRSTVWWNFEAEESGFIRFIADGEEGPWVLTVHLKDQLNSEKLEIVASNLWQRSDREVLFRANKNAEYLIALGVHRGGLGGKFTLKWEEALDPKWLRITGRVSGGEPNSLGDRVHIREPSDLTIEDTGKALYLAAATGLHVFSRDAHTGQLDPVQNIESDFDFATARLIWDSNRNRVLVNDCSEWYAFQVEEDDMLVDDGTKLSLISEDECAMRLLIDMNGKNLYRIARQSIEHITIEQNGTLQEVSTKESYLADAVLSNDQRRLYTLGPSSVSFYELDGVSGSLTLPPTRIFNQLIPSHTSIAISDTDSHLFYIALDEDWYVEMSILSIENPLEPVKLGRLNLQKPPSNINDCRFIDARYDDISVDMYCNNVIFSSTWDEATQIVNINDQLIARETDRFNNFVHYFGIPRGMVVSPDDQHVYVSTEENDILIITRGWPTDELAEL